MHIMVLVEQGRLYINPNSFLPTQFLNPSINQNLFFLLEKRLFLDLVMLIKQAIVSFIRIICKFKFFVFASLSCGQ